MSLRDRAENLRYVFVGNRKFVIDEMLSLRLEIAEIFAIKGSHLERQLLERGVSFKVVEAKKELLDELGKLNFDILVSNGCPFILPVERFVEREILCVNIHPSYLPDLRGADPVLGALLNERDSGATCHVMDRGVDTGDIIARVRVPYSEDLDAGLLYQLSFMAEKEAFAEAFDKAFEIQEVQAPEGDEIYFTRSAKDQQIDFRKHTLHQIVRKTRAFSNRSQGAVFEHQGEEFRVYGATISRNPYLMEKIENFEEREIVFAYEDVVVVRKEDAFLKLERVSGATEVLFPGDMIG